MQTRTPRHSETESMGGCGSRRIGEVLYPRLVRVLLPTQLHGLSVLFSSVLWEPVAPGPGSGLRMNGDETDMDY